MANNQPSQTTTCLSGRWTHTNTCLFSKFTFTFWNFFFFMQYINSLHTLCHVKTMGHIPILCIDIFFHYSCSHDGGIDECDDKIESEAQKPTSCGMIKDPNGGSSCTHTHTLTHADTHTDNQIPLYQLPLVRCCPKWLNPSLSVSPGIFKECHAVVPPGPYFENCVYDQCGTDGSAVALCQAIESYADLCAKANVPISWRNTTFCRKCAW